MHPELAALIRRVTGRRAIGMTALGGGCVAEVHRVRLAGGGSVVVKRGRGLDVEAMMLRYLAAHGLPVPEVVHAGDKVLVLSFIETAGGITAGAEADAGRLLAALHAVGADRYGFQADTVIGGLAQPNHWEERWLAFFRDRRLLFIAGEALAAGQLPAATMIRIEALAGRLERWLDEPAAPSLIHGDLWSGNVLCRDGQIAGFVDPAIYYADAEIELAFSTLFGTFGDAFFASYGERRPLRPGFFEVRRDLYNLYPLLVHVRLFGASYLGAVHRTLARFGA